jgi:hypothetical protein
MNAFNIPTLPTDTLYKFLTMFGLIILLTTLLTPAISLKDNNINKFKLALDFKRLEQDKSNTRQDINALDSTFKIINKNKWYLVKTYVDRNGKLYFDSTSYKLFDYVRTNLNSSIYLLARKQDSLLITNQQLENLYSSELEILTYCNKGILYGLIISACGFLLWFFNNQVYHDLFLKMQVGYKFGFKEEVEDIVELPKNKKNKRLKYLDNWNSLIAVESLKTVLIIIIVIVGCHYAYYQAYPNGFFVSKKFILLNK